jgi:hypothetical protein
LKDLEKMRADAEIEEKYMKNVEGWKLHEPIYSRG